MECDVFMSDDASQYFNSWKSAFCDPTDNVPQPKKLLCTWHVLRNWRKQILAMVQKDNVVLVWSGLAIILREQDQATFYQHLSKFITELNEGEPEFSQYFRREYCGDDRVKEWAFWARKGSVVNVNMFLEAFHRTLKKKHLERNENHRLDFLLARLFDAALWYLEEYVVAKERDDHQNSYRVKEMHDHHRRASKIQPSHVSVVGPRHWKIEASSKDGTQYDVIRIKEHCQCGVRCQYCDVCSDMYDCSCPGALFGSIACKHIHFI